VSYRFETKVGNLVFKNIFNRKIAFTISNFVLFVEESIKNLIVPKYF
jgi:hypothetical protein